MPRSLSIFTKIQSIGTLWVYFRLLAAVKQTLCLFVSIHYMRSPHRLLRNARIVVFPDRTVSRSKRTSVAFLFMGLHTTFSLSLSSLLRLKILAPSGFAMVLVSCAQR